MFVNTAICAISCAIAAASLQLGRTPSGHLVARVFGAVSALIAGLSGLEHLTDINFGIDTLLMERDWGRGAATHPMRMGPPASFSLTSLGVAYILATFSEKQRRVGSMLGFLSLLVAFLSLTGYWFGADQLFGIARLSGIAWQSSLMIAALSIAVMCLIPEHGLVAELRRPDPGGVVLRRLIVPIIVVPLLLGGLRIKGEDAEWFDPRFGTALRTLAEILLLASLLWWTSKGIGRHASSTREVRERLAAIVDSSDDAIISKSLDGIIQSWNLGAERLFGYSAQEAVGQSIYLLIPDDRTAEEQEILARLRRGERLEHYETVRKGRDGRLINVSLTVSPIKDELGNVIGASKIARDITEQKHAEEAIRRSEAELQELANSLPQLIWMARPDGFVYWFNHRWHEYTGADPGELEGWQWRTVHHPDYLLPVEEEWRRCCETGEPFEMEFPLRGSDGVYRWFLTRANPHRDAEGHIVRWLGSNTNVDDAKRVERDLREKTHTLELLNETGVVVGSTLDLHKLVQQVTDIATRLSGAEFGAFFYNTTDERGESYALYTLSGATRDLFDRFGQPRSTPLFGPTFRGEGLIRSDDIREDPRYGQWGPHFGTPEGHLPVRSYLAVPVMSRMGEVIGGLFFGHSKTGVFTEATERIIGGVASHAGVAIDNARLYENQKSASEERATLLEAERSARAEAERLNLMKDEFLATLSHELRTPLNAILGWSQLLSLSDTADEDFAQGLEAIERNARAQTQLIEDLLDMSRIISGKVRLDVQWTDIAEVLQQSIGSIQPSADAKQIRLRKIIDPNPGPVSGDPVRLQQVFWNLLSNAIKFTPKGGTVDIVLERVNSHLEVTIRDSGIGISSEFLPLVFERFRQADSSTTRTFGGLGLGLSIVKSLVELHGGSVRAESPGEGKGASFVVILPLSPIRDGHGRTHPTGTNSSNFDLNIVSLRDVKVLVLDDEPDARGLLKRILMQCEADVTTATSAQEALTMVADFQPHVVVSDIGMPEVDGYEFIRRLRKLPVERGGKTPAIALTAFARSEDRTRAMLAGYQVHISKPIEPHELVTTVGTLVGRVGSA